MAEVTRMKDPMTDSTSTPEGKSDNELNMVKVALESPAEPSDIEAALRSCRSGGMDTAALLPPLEQMDREIPVHARPQKNALPVSTSINNTQSTPWARIGKLLVSGGQQFFGGTGVMIGPRHVLTSAHVIYDRATKKSATSIRFIAGLTPTQQPFGQVAVSQMWWAPDRYLYSPPTDQEAYKFDVALLVLQGEPRLLNVPPLRMTVLPDNFNFAGARLRVTGYPARSPGTQMVSQACDGLGSDALIMRYNAATVQGYSGGAVWREVGPNQTPELIGIHQGEFSSGNSLAIRLNAALVAKLKQLLP